MSDWGHEGHVGPRKTYYTSRTHVRVNAYRGVLVAPRGPNAKEVAVSCQSLGPRLGYWGHVPSRFSYCLPPLDRIEVRIWR
jgi:hypothetical protein